MTVPIDQLHCPTCGTQYPLPLRGEVLERDVVLATSMFAPLNLHTVKLAPVIYVRCPEGHMWTVKAVRRSYDAPDEIQLGEYLGDA